MLSMPYLIDGHNLIAAMPDIDLADPDDEAKLVIKLRGFAARKQTKCTVIFDRGLPGGESQLSTGSVKVIFASAEHSNADALIKRRIRNTRDARNHTLVSSDREIADYARSHRMRLMTAAEFSRELGRSDRSRDRSESDQVTLSEDEIDEWLDIFGENNDE